MSKNISGYVPRTFRDAGTQEVFEGGRNHDFEPGAYRNYAAGKKVEPPRKPVDAQAQDAAPAKGKPAA